MKTPWYFLLIGSAVICCGSGAASQVDELIDNARGKGPDALLRDARKILQIDPHCGDAYAMIGCVEYLRRDYVEAIRDFSKAVQLHPKRKFWLTTARNYGYHSYIEQGNWKAALSECDECLKLEPEPRVANDAALLCKKLSDREGYIKYKALAKKYRQNPSPGQTRIFVPLD
jgi:tetratricopeptide (TPR) repeat protein